MAILILLLNIKYWRNIINVLVMEVICYLKYIFPDSLVVSLDEITRVPQQEPHVSKSIITAELF